MSNWKTICSTDELTANTGICALFNGKQVAIFYCGRSEQLFAISNFDPFAQQNVLSRGIIGSTKGRHYVASPLYKQRFDLQNGQCIDEPTVNLETFTVRVFKQHVQLQAE
ncbi:MAG: nitrite reductase small subunit NirD [Psychromonas sp.]|nr:nitrite reductase small subunit NirD [Alteromonadales bacterium]MCP5076752.1 nitrite reductase small subunit NirD [Psychromonas sp.]